MPTKLYSRFYRATLIVPLQHFTHWRFCSLSNVCKFAQWQTNFPHTNYLSCSFSLLSHNFLSGCLETLTSKCENKSSSKNSNKYPQQKVLKHDHPLKHMSTLNSLTQIFHKWSPQLPSCSFISKLSLDEYFWMKWVIITFVNTLDISIKEKFIQISSLKQLLAPNITTVFWRVSQVLQVLQDILEATVHPMYNVGHFRTWAIFATLTLP